MIKKGIDIWTCWVCTHKNYKFKFQTATYNICDDCGTPKNTTSTFKIKTCKNTDGWLRTKY